MFAGCGEQVLAALQNHGPPSGVGKPLSHAHGNNRNLSPFLARRLTISPTKTASVLEVQKPPGHKQMESIQIESQFDLLVSGRLDLHFGVQKLDPKRGAVLSAKFCHRAKNSASFDCFRGYATEVLHTAGFPWFYSAASNCSPRPANMYVRAYS